MTLKHDVEPFQEGTITSRLTDKFKCYVSVRERQKLTAGGVLGMAFPLH